MIYVCFYFSNDLVVMMTALYIYIYYKIVHGVQTSSWVLLLLLLLNLHQRGTSQHIVNANIYISKQSHDHVGSEYVSNVGGDRKQPEFTGNKQTYRTDSQLYY